MAVLFDFSLLQNDDLVLQRRVLVQMLEGQHNCLALDLQFPQPPLDHLTEGLVDIVEGTVQDVEVCL